MSNGIILLLVVLCLVNGCGRPDVESPSGSSARSLIKAPDISGAKRSRTMTTRAATMSTVDETIQIPFRVPSGVVHTVKTVTLTLGDAGESTARDVLASPWPRPDHLPVRSTPVPPSGSSWDATTESVMAPVRAALEMESNSVDADDWAPMKKVYKPKRSERAKPTCFSTRDSAGCDFEQRKNVLALIVLWRLAGR